MKFAIHNKCKNKAGVYQITNLSNGRFYIGSTKNLFSRFKTHLYELRNNKHKNRLLQNDWNKYSKGTRYEFTLLEIVSNPKDRLRVEQKWLNQVFKHPNCCNHKSKVNNKPRSIYSNSPEETKKKISKIRKKNWKDSNYRKNQITSQRETKNSKEGRQKQSENSKALWKNADYRSKVIEAHKKSYSLIDPTGTLVSFVGVSDFVIKHNLSLSSFYKLLRKEIYQHKGWTLPGTDKQEMLSKTRDNRAKAFAKSYAMISPDGEIITIYNMKKFCEENRLHKSSMLRVYKGQYKQHKGWKRISK